MSSRSGKRRQARREVEAGTLSFLDVISCGFGAIILLLVLSKFFEPINLQTRTQSLDVLISELKQQLAKMRGETEILNEDLNAVREQLSKEKIRLARLQGDLSSVKGQYSTTEFDSSVAKILEDQLALANNALKLETARVETITRTPGGMDTIGGIPLDSEYIIFVIDTSGSMRQFAWNTMRRTMNDVLNVYPSVKGIQVMNDNGYYLLAGSKGQWLKDSPTQRRAILGAIGGWTRGSNSNPVEGIRTAIDDFYDPNKNISIYVLGDEFSGRGSVAKVTSIVRSANQVGGDGTRRVRIHAIGFPTVIVGPGARSSGPRFARLMHALCEDNNGTFVALPTLDGRR